MKFKLPLLLFLTLFFININNTFSQKILKLVNENSFQFQNKTKLNSKINPKNYSIFSLDNTSLQKSVDKQLNKQEAIIELPDGNGNFLKYQLKEIFTLDKELAKKYPMIKSYVAVGIDNPNFSARISMGLDGFHALVKTDENGTLYIDPYTKDKKEYIVYKRADLDSQGKDFECLVNDAKMLSRVTQSKNAAADDVQLREFDLALACTGEYAQFHLTRQGISASATDATKKAAVLSAMNTSITRVNNVFEKDLSVTLKIIATNDNIIFLDGNTDNLTNSNEGILIDEIQSVIDTRIGSANYDIGHVFSTGDNAGVAIFESVCQTNQKSRGVTGRVVPVGDAFDIDFVAHEIGHQFGATHTYNNSCGGQRTNSTAVEPGSGSTIMAYAGICSPNVQSNSDDYFHTVSITQIKNYVTNSTTNCVTLKGAVNPAPVVNAGSDYNIPKSTPFVLRGNATDTNNPNSLTYNWEQVDTEIATMAPLATNSGGPMFRSLPSKIASDRYMPALQTVVAGNTSSTWEVVPSVTRNMDFALTVRDNDVNGGATSRDDMRVTVLNADPFTVSVPNASIIWDAGTTQTISWNKGTTDVAPINCSFVNIKLSVDGGLTFPITIKANTPNDGSEAIVVPNNVSTKARIMVEAADNIFYNVNAGNFTIQSTIPTFVLTNPNGTQFVCNTGNEEANFVLNFDFVNNFSENVTLSATLPNDLNGAIVTFSPTSLNADGNVTMNVKNLNGKTSKSYTINVQGSSNSVTNNINVDLNITQSSFNQVVLTSPTNGITGHSLKDNLQWVLDANASSYDVEVATDFSFTNIVLSGNVISNSYNIVSLQGNTTYYWRVKPKNSCGEGVFSNTFNFTTSAPYCLSTFTDEANGSEHITNVTFNTINNNSGNDTEDGYQDFSAISTNVKRGDSHQISVSFNTGDYRDHCYVFIDWNQDLVFNTTNERYDLGNRFDSNVADGTTEVATSTFTIPIPADAKFGSTGMRVIVEYFGDGAPNGEGPCDADHQSEWGETEDYTVVVDNPTSIKDVAFDNFNLYPNPTKGAFTLTLQLVNTDKTTLQLFDVRGRLIDEKKYLNTKTNFSEKIFFEKASAGLYLLRVINGGKQTTRKLIVN